MLPIKTSELKANIPSIMNIKPEKVLVYAKTTESTNGEKTAISFESSNYSYDESTGEVTITVSNNTSADGKISWVKNAQDKYEIIMIYPEEVIEAIENEIQDNSKKMDKLKDMYIMEIIDKEELQEQSTEIKDNIARLTLKKERISNYSLYEKVTQLQDKVVEIEEFLHNPSIESAVKYIEKVLYWKDDKTTEVNTVFKS